LVLREREFMLSKEKRATFEQAINCLKGAGTRSNYSLASASASATYSITESLDRRSRQLFADRHDHTRQAIEEDPRNR
jgi:hypothetical protein